LGESAGRLSQLMVFEAPYGWRLASMRSLSFPLELVPATALRDAPVPRKRLEARDDDAELVRCARKRDRWAEEALYQRHVRDVLRVSLRLLARSTEAEDVVQDAFVIAFSKLDALEDGAAFGAWLLRIAVHQVHRRYRRRRLLRALGLDRGQDDAALAQQVDPGAGPEVRAALAELEQLLSQLPTSQRMAWMLRCVEGQKLDAVALACGCSRATAKRLIARADGWIQQHVRVAPSEGEHE
jgi:RNA polymerase sigma-70 factor (ECF subfamily)